MEEKIIVRLFHFLKEIKVPHTRFEKEIGLSNGYLKTQLRRNADLGETVIRKIVDNSLSLNLDWLLTGRGEMFRSELSSIQRNDNQELLIEKIEKLEEEKERLISIIDNQNMLLKRLQEENKMSRSGSDNEAQGLVG